jgi:hypothetical protein
MKTRITSLLAVSLFGLVLSADGQPADIRQGLVAYWPMETTDGVTTADATVFGNHLSLVGMSAGNFVAGKFGNAASLNGSSTYLMMTHGVDDYPAKGLPIYRAGSYTITMWVNGVAQTAKYLFSEGNAANNAPLLILQTGQQAANNAKFDVIIRTDGNVTLLNHIQSTNVVFDNNWHHIAWVEPGWTTLAAPSFTWMETWTRRTSITRHPGPFRFTTPSSGRWCGLPWPTLTSTD